MAARLRQQRCRARKKEQSLAQKQREQQDKKDPTHIPAHPRRTILVPRTHSVPVMQTHSFVRQPSRSAHPNVPHHHKLHMIHHRPHQPHQPHRPHQQHRPHQPHAIHRVHHSSSHTHRPLPPPQSMNANLSHPPPSHHPPHHQHQHQPHYAFHRPVPPLYMTEPPVSRVHSIGSVVSFDDGSCPKYELIIPSMMSEDHFIHHHYPIDHFEGPVATVTPTMSSDKPIVEPDTSTSLLHMPRRSPTEEETAIDAMLSLRSASFSVPV